MPVDDLIRPKAFRSELHNSYFLSLGRALSVIQHFENICRAVADFLDLRLAVHSGVESPHDPEFPDFVERIRTRMLGGAVEKLRNLPGCHKDLNALFKRAKDARNRVAHDCTLSAIHPLADEEALWISLESLLGDVRTISEADAAVCAFLYMMNEHEPLHIPHDYVETIVHWVFEDFEAEDFMQKPSHGAVDAYDT